jgi:hypothetical protein
LPAAIGPGATAGLTKNEKMPRIRGRGFDRFSESKSPPQRRSANLLRSKATKADPWVIGLRRRRPPLVVAVALANKTARIAWAVMLREKELLSARR